MALVVLIWALAACAEFPQPPVQGFQPNPPLGAGPEPTPQLPGPPTPGAAPSTGAAPGSTPPPGPCQDRDPAVVATCLDTTGGIAVLPDGASALVTERRTGRLLRVTPAAVPQLVDTLVVDGVGDGGLLDVALSPTWAEDQLLYLYLTTPTDNRVVRLSPRDAPKPILTSIPRGPLGNTGSIAFDSRGNLLVATGAAGDSGAAANPASLSGKLLRVDPEGRPAAGNPVAGSAVLATDVPSPGGVCTDTRTGTSWLTDHTPGADRLRAVLPDAGLGPAVWTWPERPGTAGCAARDGQVAVSLTSGAALYLLSTSPAGAVVAAPTVLAKDTYGRLSGADVGPDGVVWVGTVNKDGGTPVATDDRVVRIPTPAGQGGVSPA